MSTDDMPYDRIRERIHQDAVAPHDPGPIPTEPQTREPRPPAPLPEVPRPRALTDEDRRQAAEWVAFVKAARERCDAGKCTNHDCDLGRRCPFKRFKREQR